ncbi:hypothetical protein [Prochlorothrix hollandica]|nr:hypothetical protein [Prochlorothrix hollandica]
MEQIQGCLAAIALHSDPSPQVIKTFGRQGFGINCQVVLLI